MSSKHVDERPDERVEEELETLDDDEGFSEVLGSLHLGAEGEDGHVGTESLQGNDDSISTTARHLVIQAM